MSAELLPIVRYVMLTKINLTDTIFFPWYSCQGQIVRDCKAISGKGEQWLETQTQSKCKSTQPPVIHFFFPVFLFSANSLDFMVTLYKILLILLLNTITELRLTYKMSLAFSLHF